MDDVGVMLHLCDENLVALAQIWPSQTVGDEVDRLGRASDKDELARIFDIHALATRSRALS